MSKRWKKKKKKRGDKVRVRIQHPLWDTTLAKLDAGKGRERELH